MFVCRLYLSSATSTFVGEAIPSCARNTTAVTTKSRLHITETIWQGYRFLKSNTSIIMKTVLPVEKKYEILQRDTLAMKLLKLIYFHVKTIYNFEASHQSYKGQIMIFVF